MENIEKAMQNFDAGGREIFQRTPIPFEAFLRLLVVQPELVVRNVFQLFHDMIKSYVDEPIDEYASDPESIHFSFYDSSRLFVEGADNPFFADRLFANRLFANVEALRFGAQQNKIYIFQGPHGCGKSTFLNNLLMRFEQYTNTMEGSSFETVWRLDRTILREARGEVGNPLKSLGFAVDRRQKPPQDSDEKTATDSGEEACRESDLPELTEDYIEVPCPSHDHPLLMIPKDLRREFLDDLFKNTEFKYKLFIGKEYEWIFKKEPCTICSSLYSVLMEKLKSPRKVLQMVHVRPYQFNRRVGEGITVFNPSDKPLKANVFTNDILQKRIDKLLGDSNRVKYIYSQHAKTNNGIYALMDIKAHNALRLIDLHNIISEGLLKVEDTEENVDSLFLALMNPEDMKNIEEFPSFSDRIESITIPYVMDLNTEVEIYRNIFGRHINEHFLPRVLHNFARVIISTRLSLKSEAMLEWIDDSKKYSLYCDENLQLLKMEIYTGNIPSWLSEDDLKRFTAGRRRRIIRESENEGNKGFSGRDSIKIFNELFSAYAEEETLISMTDLYEYFTKKVGKEMKEAVPKEFLQSLMRLYDYTVLQEVKESLYYYNEEQISRAIKNYLFATNFEPGAVDTCTYTGDKLEITDEFFDNIETSLLGSKADKKRKYVFRKDTQKEYAARTLPQEILVEGKPITETKLYLSLHERYVHNLKDKVLDPFLKNENFRRGIKDYNREDFKTYDKKIREDVAFLMNNLSAKYGYTRRGAKEVCIYVIDRDLAKVFSQG